MAYGINTGKSVGVVSTLLQTYLVDGNINQNFTVPGYSSTTRGCFACLERVDDYPTNTVHILSHPNDTTINLQYLKAGGLSSKSLLKVYGMNGANGWGLKVVDDDGVVRVSSNTQAMQLVASGTVPLESHGTLSDGVNHQYDLPYTNYYLDITSLANTYGSDNLAVAVRLPAGIPFETGISNWPKYLANGYGGYAIMVSTYNTSGSETPEYLVFAKSTLTASTSPHGLTLFNSFGSKVFDSSLQFMDIVGTFIRDWNAHPNKNSTVTYTAKNPTSTRPYVLLTSVDAGLQPYMSIDNNTAYACYKLLYMCGYGATDFYTIKYDMTPNSHYAANSTFITNTTNFALVTVS